MKKKLAWTFGQKTGEPALDEMAAKACDKARYDDGPGHCEGVAFREGFIEGYKAGAPAELAKALEVEKKRSTTRGQSLLDLTKRHEALQLEFAALVKKNVR